MIKAGGLHIVGTERHESRRIDNQLRGRAGRQGDPGSSRFYLSLEDPLLRIFGGERLGVIMQKLKMPEGEPIEHPIVNRSIAKAQNRVESRNFDIRKQLLEYDDVANDQRRVIYQQRNELLEGSDVAETIGNMIRGQIEDTVKLHVPPESIEEQWDVPRADHRARGRIPDHGADRGVGRRTTPRLTDETIRERVVELAQQSWKQREAMIGPELMRQFERSLMLQTLDHHWREHLALARSPASGHSPARLRAEEPEAGIQARGVRALLRHARPHQAGRRQGRADGAGAQRAGRAGGRGGRERVERQATSTRATTRRSPRRADDGDVAVAPPPPFTRASEKVGPQRPVPVRSGKKYKHCHGKF